MKQTHRSLYSLAALLAAAIGAIAFAYYGVFEKEEKEKTAKEEKAKLFSDVDRAKIVGLTVSAKGETTVLAPKAGGSWEVVSPVQSAADKATLDSLLDRLFQLKSKQTVEKESKDLAKFGLDTPAIRVVARFDGKPDLALRVGADNSFDGSTYVALGDSSDVIQAEGGFKWALEKTTFDLRDKKVLDFEDANVRELALRVDQSSYLLKKQGGSWMIDGAKPEKAEETTVNRLLGSLRSVNATAFPTDRYSPADETRFGFAKPRLEATVTLEGGARLTLVAAEASDQKTYARRKETSSVAEVSPSVFTDLTVSPADLRDKTVLAFDKEKAAKLTFTFGTESVQLERAKGADAGAESDWKITAPTAGAAKKWKVSSLLWSLSALKAQGFADEDPKDLAKYGLAQPARTVAVLGEDGKELGAIAIGSAKEGQVYVKSAADTRVFEVEESRLTELPASRMDLEEPPAAGKDAAKATP